MKKLFDSKRMTAALLLACAALMTGCGSNPMPEAAAETAREPLALGIVVGNRTDVPELTYNVLAPALTQLVTYGGDCSIYVSDGRPENTLLQARFEPIADDMERNAKQKEAAARTQNVYAALASAVAKAEDADILQAMQLAADALHASSIQDQRMIVLDNGLSTAGAIPLATLEGYDPAADLERLAVQNCIPEFEGISVTWYGIGVTSGFYEQSLPQKDVLALQTLWGGIVERGGGVMEFSKENIRSSAQRSTEERGLPACKRVQPSQLDTEIRTTVAHTEYVPEETVPVVNAPIVIDGETVQFQPNRFQLEDPVQAAANLEPLAAAIRESGQEILLIGTIATVNSSDGGVAFSQQRASTVKDLLVELGVEVTRIHTAGAGCLDPMLTENDQNADGSLNEAIAQRNRAVWIFSLNDAANQELIQRYLNQ